MAWERRGNFQYYYKKERQGSRVKSIYVGRGHLAELTATLRAVQHEDRKLMSEKLKHDQSLLDAFVSVNHNVERAVNTVTEAALIAAGFHQHKREWRKRRT
jgi:hypothetical protein